MSHETSIHDTVPQRRASLAEEPYLLGSTFTLQHHTGAIEQSSEEFYELVSKISVTRTETSVVGTFFK